MAFGAFFAFAGCIWSGVGLKGLAESKDQIGAQVSEEFLIVGVIVLGGGALLLFFGIRSEPWRPTAQELARQKAGDYRQLYFRPVGLLLLLIALGGFIALGIWVEQYIPGLTKRQGFGHSPLAYVFGIVFLASMAIRRVRNFVFYAEPPSSPGKSGSNVTERHKEDGGADPAKNPGAEQSAAADRPRE
jgi:hypothetical protein